MAPGAPACLLLRSCLPPSGPSRSSRETHHFFQEVCLDCRRLCVSRLWQVGKGREAAAGHLSGQPCPMLLERRTEKRDSGPRLCTTGLPAHRSSRERNGSASTLSPHPDPAAGSDAVKASVTTALPAGICCGWSRVTRAPGLSHWSPTSGREAGAFFKPGSQTRAVTLWTPRDSHTFSGLPGISHSYRG